MKIDYILNVLSEKEMVSSINYEDKDFIKEVCIFIQQYNNYVDNLPKSIIKNLLNFLSKQETLFKKRYIASGKTYLFSYTNYVIESIRKKISMEANDLCKNYNLDINHQEFSVFVFEKVLSRQANIIAYRGDSRDPSIIFQQGFQCFYDPNIPVLYRNIDNSNRNYKNFIKDPFISGIQSVGLTSDFKVAGYFPIVENIDTYIYICKINRFYNTGAEHYKRFILNKKDFYNEYFNEYLMGVRLNEINTDRIDPKDVYAAFKIERSLMYKFKDIKYYNRTLPLKRSFKIKSIVFNNEKANLVENSEFMGVKKYLTKVFRDLVNKEFIFSIDDLIKK